jgi:sulfur-carrier protein
MRVLIPSPLRSYTGGQDEVAGRGDTVGAVLADLERQFPGIRFRMIDEQGRVRSHIKVFVGGELRDDLAAEVPDGAAVQIVAALSGG